MFEEVISFNSQSKYPNYLLSNFAYIKEGIVVEEIKYPSTEHAFQAQKYIEEDRIRFSVDGDLGKMNMGIKLVFEEKLYEKKRKYWLDKKENIGIIAKMATNEKIGKKLGLRRKDNFISTDEIWINILSQKFKIQKFKEVLINTGSKYLLEFDRCAEKNNPYWSGIIKNGILYGNNQMGKYLMIIRSQI